MKAVFRLRRGSIFHIAWHSWWTDERQQLRAMCHPSISQNRAVFIS